jgi:hypothetical protein
MMQLGRIDSNLVAKIQQKLLSCLNDLSLPAADNARSLPPPIVRPIGRHGYQDRHSVLLRCTRRFAEGYTGVDVDTNQTPEAASEHIKERLESISGKPVLVHRDPDFAGHASIRIASADAPAHLLRYKPEFETELPYLSAFQCGMALRSIQAKTINRFDLGSTPTMVAEVKQLIEDHLRSTGPAISMSMVPQLCQQLGHGLGLQLRSMPIAIRVDEWLYRDYPALANLQRKSIERQLQEAMHSLGPSVRVFAPQRIIDANVGMSCAFAKFWAAIFRCQ